MDLTPYVDQLRRELAVAAAAGGEDARALAERLTAPLESAVRLTLLDALSVAADEITRDLAPSSVHVQLRGRNPEFVVQPAPTAPPAAEAPAGGFADGTAATGDGTEGGMTRINLRLPEYLKVRVEEAAGRQRLSVNAWLVRAVNAALDTAALDTDERLGRRTPYGGQRYTGWVR